MLETVTESPLIFGMLFLLLSLGIGLLLVWVAELSPVAPFFQRCGGIASAFASTLAVLFGLLAAFLANDVWTQSERGRAAVVREADAIRVVLSLTVPLAERAKTLHDLTVEYGALGVREDWRAPPQQAAASRQMRRMLQEVLFGGFASVDGGARRAATTALAEIRAAHRERVSVANSVTAGRKWVAAFILGVLTQVAIVIVHLGRPRAATLAITVYTLGMAFIMWIILARLDPFSGMDPISLQPIVAAVAAAG